MNKSISAAIIAGLILTAPGLPCYRSLAAVSGPRSLNGPSEKSPVLPAAPAGSAQAPSVPTAIDAGLSPTVPVSEPLASPSALPLPVAAAAQAEIIEAELVSPEASGTAGAEGQAPLADLQALNQAAGQDQPGAAGVFRQTFDGATAQRKQDTDVGLSPTPGARTFLRNPLIAKYSRDEFGGPRPLELAPLPATTAGVLPRNKARLWRSKEQVLYGLKWGVFLVGIAFVTELALSATVGRLPWQSVLSAGRVELLAGEGPNEIRKALTESPLSFFASLPWKVFSEELTYRLSGFALPFLYLAALRPLSRAAAGFLQRAPDVMGLASLSLRAAKTADAIGRNAYPITALMSAWAFALAHVPLWGFHPVTFGVHFASGLALARVAYRSRSFTAPFVAHLSFALFVTVVGFGLPLWLIPQAALGASWLLNAAAAAFLAFQIRAYWKARSAAVTAGEAALDDAARADLTLWRRGRARAGWLKAGLAAAVLGLYGSGVLLSAAGDFIEQMKPAKGSRPAIAAPWQEPAQERPALTAAEIVAKAKPAVVQVASSDGSGSGYIVSPDGLLVTNAHVVALHLPGGVSGSEIPPIHEEKVKIYLHGEEKPVEAPVVGFNPKKDIALVQLPKRDTPYPWVPLGDSARLVEGDRVLTLGYPLALSFTSAQGVVSGLGEREIRHPKLKDPRPIGTGHVSYVQTDASINHGNSGGPMMNDRGEVVGMNSLGIDASVADNIGFAIASADIRAALEQYMALGHINNPRLGALFQPGDPSAPKTGARVDYVQFLSAASKAGLKQGDVILAVDGAPVAAERQAASIRALRRGLLKHRPGDTAILRISRDGAILDLTVPLDSDS